MPADLEFLSNGGIVFGTEDQAQILVLSGGELVERLDRFAQLTHLSGDGRAEPRATRFHDTNSL